jgi:hypothetical protein
MSWNRLLIAAAAVLPVFVASAANAALITDISGLGGPNTAVTAFGPAGQYVTGYSEVIAGANPLAMTYAGGSGLYVDYASSWGLGTNGDVVPGTPSIGINQGGSLTFVFQNGPASGFGFLMNYAPGFGPVSIIALDASLNPFQTYDITIAAPIVGLPFQFRGIQDLSVDIYGFELLATGNPSPLFDSISYTAAISDVPVPEPATIALVLSGLGVMGGLRRRKK